MSRETNSERALDTIVVGIRHRKELGDIDELAHSMSQIGLLQPITITPDGVLVCGRRRLEAARRLGWHTIKVWVRSGISDRLTELLAQQDENSLHKPLTLTEQAALYAELKELYAEEALRKKQATQFGVEGVEPGVGPSGAVTGPEDSSGPGCAGEARYLAAKTVTGSGSFQRLDHVRFLQMVAKDPFQPSTVRDLASTELAAIIDDGAPVEPAYRKVQAAIELAAHPTAETESTETFNAEATQRARQKNARRGLHPAPPAPTSAPAPAAPIYRSTRSFLLTWNDLDGWSQHYDAEQLAAELSDEQYDRFDRVISESVAFRERLALAREEQRDMQSSLTPAT